MMANFQLNGHIIRQPEDKHIRLLPWHPRYEHMSERRMSTVENNWHNHRDRKAVNKMAEYGLYYTGLGDIWRCFYCNEEVEWSTDTDPLLEHVRISPICCYLADTVDPHKLQYYKALCVDARIQAEVATVLLRNDITTVSGKQTSRGDVQAQTVETMAELVRENERLRKQCICHLCKSRDINVLLLPCAHTISCHGCASSLSICPMCKKVIEEKVNVYRK